MITYYSGSNTYNIHDEEVMIDLFMAKIIDSILSLREPAEPISFTLASELVSGYIDKYNHINKAGCRRV